MSWIELPEKPKKVQHKRRGKRKEELMRCYDAYRNLRKIHLAKYPLCCMCEEQGIIRKATEVHHRIPILRGKDIHEMMALATNPDNLMSLCHEHHEEIHNKNKIDPRFLV